MCHAQNNAHTAGLYQKLNILNIHQLVEKSYAFLMYKFSTRTLPENIQALFTANTNIHSYRTRQCLNPHFDKHRSQLYGNCFLHKSKIVWQSLPNTIKNSKTSTSFNKRISTHLMSSNIWDLTHCNLHRICYFTALTIVYLIEWLMRINAIQWTKCILNQCIFYFLFCIVLSRHCIVRVSSLVCVYLYFVYFFLLLSL